MNLWRQAIRRSLRRALIQAAVLAGIELAWHRHDKREA